VHDPSAPFSSPDRQGRSTTLSTVATEGGRLFRRGDRARRYRHRRPIRGAVAPLKMRRHLRSA